MRVYRAYLRKPFREAELVNTIGSVHVAGHTESDAVAGKSASTQMGSNPEMLFCSGIWPKTVSNVRLGLKSRARWTETAWASIRV